MSTILKPSEHLADVVGTKLGITLTAADIEIDRPEVLDSSVDDISDPTKRNTLAYIRNTPESSQVFEHKLHYNRYSFATLSSVVDMWMELPAGDYDVRDILPQLSALLRVEVTQDDIVWQNFTIPSKETIDVVVVADNLSRYFVGEFTVSISEGQPVVEPGDLGDNMAQWVAPSESGASFRFSARDSSGDLPFIAEEAGQTLMSWTIGGIWYSSAWHVAAGVGDDSPSIVAGVTKFQTQVTPMLNGGYPQGEYVEDVYLTVYLETPAGRTEINKTKLVNGSADGTHVIIEDPFSIDYTFTESVDLTDPDQWYELHMVISGADTNVGVYGYVTLGTLHFAPFGRIVSG